jgi:hypothetical protein
MLHSLGLSQRVENWKTMSIVVWSNSTQCLCSTRHCTYARSTNKTKFRQHHLLNELTLVTTCSLYIIQRARICSIYNNITVTAASLWIEWRMLLRDIMLAKRRIVMECGTESYVLDGDIC